MPPPPEPPHRGAPLSRITELNQATAPHTPVPPRNDALPTARPPRPDPRPPPRQYAQRTPMVTAPSVNRASAPDIEDDWGGHTEIGPSPVLQAPPMRPKLDSREVSTETLLAELAAKGDEARAAQTKAERLLAELEAERRKPAPAPSLVPPATVDRYELQLERKARKPVSDGALKDLLLKLGAALTGLIVALTASAQLANQYIDWKLKGIEAKQSAQAEVIKPLPAAAASADKSADACRDWAKATDDYNRQIFAKLGVVIPQRPNAPPVTEIKTRAPAHKANAVTGAPVLEVITPPPPLP